MGSLIRVCNVEEGSTVKVGGVDYIVNENLYDDLDISNDGYDGYLSDLIDDCDEDTCVAVISSPVNVNETRLNQLLAEKKVEKKTSLTESFKSQLHQEQPKEDCTDSQARLSASLAAKKAKKAGHLALTADLKAQRVHQATQGMSVDLSYAEKAIEDLYTKSGQLYRESKQTERDIENLAVETQNAFDAVGQDVQYLDFRVTSLEAKEEQREAAKYYQDQLNQKLSAKKAEGGNKMKNILGQFKGLFGKVEGIFAYSPAGLAMRNGLTKNFVVYDKKTGSITDVQDAVLDFKVPAFRLPVEAKDIKPGDIVVNQGTYAYVTDVAKEFVKVVYPTKNSQGTVLPTKNLLLQKPFYTVIRTFDIAAQQDGFNPALLAALGDGGSDEILPFLLMSGGLNASGSGIDPMTLMMLKDSTDDLLPFLLLQQGGLTQDGFNPLMLLATKGGKGKDILPFLLMQGQGGAAQGGFNPMMLALLDGDIDPMTLMLMGGFGGQNPFGSVQAPTSSDKEEK